jgi:5-methylcytosine-specific restriction endonuclease McrA
MPSEYERVPTALRQEIAQRAKNRCEYCRCPDAFSPDSFTVDHIKPRQLGGATIAENLAWACFGCNGRKYTRTHRLDRRLPCSILASRIGQSILIGVRI